MNGWWTISAGTFQSALRRCEAGESADLVYAEHYANSRIESPSESVESADPYSTCPICGSGDPLLVPVLGPGVICLAPFHADAVKAGVLLAPVALIEQAEQERDDLLREMHQVELPDIPSYEEVARRRDALVNVAHTAAVAMDDAVIIGGDGARTLVVEQLRESLQVLGVTSSELDAVGIKL